MPPQPQLTALIDKVDTFELVRDQIAAVLLLELTQQQVLAEAATEEPDDWNLRIFVERANPWAEFIDAPTEKTETVPIVNVSLDNANIDARASNLVERQKVIGVYNIDCYGYGFAEDDGAGGHTAGDARAALEAQRAARLVRNILMAAAYAYLGMRGVVWKRWVQSIAMLQPQIDNRTVQQIVAARVQLHVEFNEFSPQVEGEALELVAGAVRRKETGEIYFEAHYEYAPPSP